MRNALLVGMLSVVTAPALAVAQGLGPPRTLTPWQVQCADIPLSAPPAVTLAVEASERGDGRMVATTGELVVIRAGTDQGLAIGQNLVARHVERGRVDYTGPRADRPGVRFGRNGYYGGIRGTALLTIERIDARFALARIVKACDQVEVGDLLEPAVIPTLPAAAAMGAENFDDRAAVLFGRDLRTEFGDGDVLSINRGSSHGVTPGTRFSLYHVQANHLPMSERGEAVVLDVAETTSRAVLVRVRDVVQAGDVAVRRAAGQP
jgi:hypothetical protein